MVDLLLEAKASTKMVTNDIQSSCLHIAAKNNAVRCTVCSFFLMYFFCIIHHSHFPARQLTEALIAHRACPINSNPWEV